MTALSTVIPTHNGARYLGEALESIAAQSLKPIEVIVVDDGSTDNTAEVVESCRALLPDLIYVRQEQRGAPAARNAGAARAHGDLLHFLDADDLLLRDFYLHLVSVLDASPQHGAACCQRFVCYGDSARRHVEDNCWLRELPLGKAMEIGNPFGTSFTLVRRAVFETLGGFSEAFPFVHDEEFATRLLARVPGEVSPERHVVYRQHAGSLSNAEPAVLVERLLGAEAIAAADRETYGALADTYIQYWLAVFLDQARRFDEAEARLERLFAASPEHPAGRLLRIRLLLGRDALDEAKREAEALHARFPDCGQVAAALGRIRDAEGDGIEAARLLRHAVEVEQDDGQRQHHQLALARVLARLGRIEEARALLTTVLEEAGALDDEPDEPFALRARYAVASELEQAGLVEEAIAGFERVTSSPLCAGEIGAGAQYHLGSLYAATGQTERAGTCLAECLRLNPQHRRAAETLRALRASSFGRS